MGDAINHDRRFEPVEQPLPGVHLIARQPIGDTRGSFCRLFCSDEINRLGGGDRFEQANLSCSMQAGTLRGLHYQIGDAAETKIVTCLRGRILDVVLDLRPDSPMQGAYAAFELSDNNAQTVIVPKGCAHGFMTLEPDSMVLYFVSAAYDSAAERGVRYNDPSLTIRWPRTPSVISERDRHHPDLVLQNALS